MRLFSGHPRCRLIRLRIQTNTEPYWPGSGLMWERRSRTGIYVTKRWWLDAGVEVLPGERTFTDYAFPPALGYPSFGRENRNRPIDRQPLNPPSDMGGYPQTFPLY